jgi:hypothetical protein
MENNNINDWEEVAIDDFQEVPLENRETSSEKKDLSNLDVAGLAALQSLSFGGADEIKAAIEAPFSDKTYEQIRDEERELVKQAEESNPGLYNTMSFGAGVIPAIASGGLGLVKSAASAAKAVPSLAKIAGLGAAQGAAQGLGSSEVDNISDLGVDVASGAGLGATVGGAIGAGVRGVSSLASTVLPKAKDFAYDIPLVKPFLRSRKLKKEGIDVASDRAGQRIIKDSEKLAKDMQQTLENIYKSSSKGVGKILKRSSDQGLEADISQDLARMQKSIQNTNPATAEGKASLQELQSIIDKYKQNKTLLKKPGTLVKTGEEKALEKLLNKQNKLSEQAKLVNEPVNFTEPEISENFVKSLETRQGKTFVEPITSGEFNPIKIVNEPEIIANLNAQELQTLKRQIGDISAKQDIGDIASKRIQQSKEMVDKALKERAIAPELVPALERVNTQLGATKDVSGLVNKDLLTYMNPTEKQAAINDLSKFLRKPAVGSSGDDLAQKKELFYNTLKKTMPNESAENLKQLSDELAEQYEYNVASRNIFGGISFKDPLSLLGTGKGLAVRGGQTVGALENVASKVSEAVQLDRTAARALAKQAPKPLQDVLKQYDAARLQNMSLNTALRKPTENVVESRNDRRQEFITEGTKSLNKADASDLQAFSNDLVNSGALGAEKYANTLKKLSELETKNRAPLTFSLMSDPNFRQLYKNRFKTAPSEE